MRRKSKLLIISTAALLLSSCLNTSSLFSSDSFSSQSSTTSSSSLINNSSSSSNDSSSSVLSSTSSSSESSSSSSSSSSSESSSSSSSSSSSASSSSSSSSSSSASSSSSSSSSSSASSSSSSSSSSSESSSSSSSSSSSASSSSSSSSSETSSSSSSSLPDLLPPSITALNNTYNLDETTPITFEIAFHQHQLKRIEGLGITESDYQLSGNILTIKNDYLKYFTKVGLHQLNAVFEGSQGETDHPFTFQITRANYQNRIINGNFETGDYHGWNGYQIWKDESGMFSYRNERIVSTSTYGSSNNNPYNHDGTYHLGVYGYPYSGESKDINQERMGMLRSSDFVLSGSGWISFKLGGGQNNGVSYISIKESLTNTEIARFANKNYGNTSISATANAEAYMFQYYADLSQHIGKSLYILLTDGAAHEWSVLSCDSIETYYPSTPSTLPEQIAIDIKPIIYGIGQNNNYIINDLSSNVDHWEDPLNVFQYTEHRARTNKSGGDNALSVVRSPAFKIDLSGNKYLTWEWEGNIRLDKQLFLSIKEVNTNIEMLRLVRRDDLGNKSEGGMDRHWYNLDSLSTEKEYYVELVDNAKGSWGLISLRNIELVASDSSKVSLSSDQAVNGFYGLAQVDFSTGGYRQKSDFTYTPISSVANVFASLGVVSNQEAIIGYHTNSKNTWIEFEQSENNTYPVIAETFYQTNWQVKRAYINGLSGQNTYRYRIYDRENSLPWYQFKTPNSASFTFAYASDAQSTSLKGAHVYNNMLNAALAYDNDISFAFLTGDVVERGGSTKMWQWFFEATELRKQMAIYATTGNHDYFEGDQNDAWLDNLTFERHIAHPLNGTSPFSSYYFKIGPALFIMLDAVEESNHGLQQADWFRSVVANNPHTFTIVGTHYSAYGAHHSTRSSLFRASWAPIFEECNIDLVLSGHDHIFARTAPKKNGQTDRDNGIIYLSGGSVSEKIYDIDPAKIANYDFAMTAHQNVIHIIKVNNNRISVESINQQKELISQFQIN